MKKSDRNQHQWTSKTHLDTVGTNFNETTRYESVGVDMPKLASNRWLLQPKDQGPRSTLIMLF